MHLQVPRLQGTRRRKNILLPALHGPIFPHLLLMVAGVMAYTKLRVCPCTPSRREPLLEPVTHERPRAPARVDEVPLVVVNDDRMPRMIRIVRRRLRAALGR